MTKKEIVKTISEEIGLTQLKTKEIVQKTFNAIIDTLVEDGRIELRNFGVFEVKKRAARKARNPRTGDRVDVPEKYVVTFKPGKEMEEKVRLLEERERAERLAHAQTTESPPQTPPTPPATAQTPSTASAAPQTSHSFGGSVGGSAHAASSSIPDAPPSPPSPSSDGAAGVVNPAGNDDELKSAESKDSAENNLRSPTF